jgi:hypothetical protein
MIPCRKRSDRVIQTINGRINDVGRSQAYAIDGMEVRRFLQIACFEDMDDPQRLLRDALRPIFRKDSHLPSNYESGERKRNKVDDKYVILSSVVLQPILIIVCFYDGETRLFTKNPVLQHYLGTRTIL